MDNNNESSELMSANSSIYEKGSVPIDTFYATWEPDFSGSAYQIGFGRGYNDRGDRTYNVRIGEESLRVMLPDRKTGTVTHEAIPNEPKKLGKLSLILDGKKNSINYRD